MISSRLLFSTVIFNDFGTVSTRGILLTEAIPIASVNNLKYALGDVYDWEKSINSVRQTKITLYNRQ